MDPVIETALLKQTDEALREFMVAANNAGMSKVQIAMMLRKIADEYAPSLPPGETLQ